MIVGKKSNSRNEGCVSRKGVCVSRKGVCVSMVC